MRRALLLGGSGFISSHCAEALLSANYDLTIITRGKTKFSWDFPGRVTKLTADREERATFRDFLRNLVAQTYFHLVVDFVCFVSKDIKDIIRAIPPSSIGLYVLISTDSVYEVCVPPPLEVRHSEGVRESDDRLLDKPPEALSKIDDYGFDKWKCEHELRKHPDFPFVCLRLPDVIGPREVPRARQFDLQIRLAWQRPVRIPCVECLALSPLPAPQNKSLSSSTSRASQSLADHPNHPPILSEPLLSFVDARDVGAALLACDRAFVRDAKRNFYVYKFRL
jgi:nucleoside-diphosphate-sugar epimerase